MGIATTALTLSELIMWVHDTSVYIADVQPLYNLKCCKYSEVFSVCEGMAPLSAKLTYLD